MHPNVWLTYNDLCWPAVEEAPSEGAPDLVAARPNVDCSLVDLLDGICPTHWRNHITQIWIPLCIRGHDLVQVPSDAVQNLEFQGA